MKQAVVYATGSPVLVDIEESLHRAGIELRAGIRNHEGDCWLTDPAKRLQSDALEPGLTALPFIVPLFTPSNRAQAVAEARACGFTTALSLIDPTAVRSEEHTSELQSLMRISYAVFCLKKKIQTTYNNNDAITHPI